MGTRTEPPEGDQPEVLQANEAFYKSFENLDMEEMKAVWHKSHYITCIHPGWQIISGWDNVMVSWKSIFKVTEWIRFLLSDIQVVVRGGTAWVTVVENVSMQVDGKITSGRVLATNIYERTQNGWLLVHHHASGSEPPEAEGGKEMTVN